MTPLLRLALNDVRLTLKDRAAAFWLLVVWRGRPEAADTPEPERTVATTAPAPLL